ncbi:MAG TPA: cyclase family protein [Capillimicrobium sp.]|nr:cyclase family protein [Capillimicrobium sp.]
MPDPLDITLAQLPLLRRYELGHRLDPTIPTGALHVPFRMALTMRHGDMIRGDGGSAAQEMLSLGGHTGTHIDALAHASLDGRLHGGVDAHEASRGGRFQTHGVDTLEPVIARGLLLDIAALRGEDVLPAGHAIEAEELQAAAERQGVTISAGDAVLVRTGWSAAHLHDRDAFLGLATGVPGVGVDGARLLSAKGARLAGSDTIAFEVIHREIGHSSLPVHSHLLVEAGIPIVEMLHLDELAADERWTFLLLLLPLRIAGGTGSPVRPVALA